MIRSLTFLLFWLVLVPLGRIRRLFLGSYFDTRWRDGTGSYWVSRRPPRGSEYESQL